jgi:YVTN family beta-propeller protein
MVPSRDRFVGFEGLRAAAVIVALAVASGLPAAAAELAGTLLTANRATGTVSLFDLETGIEIARLAVGPRIPHEVAVSPNGRWAVTSEYGGGDNPGRRVVVIDVVNAQITGRIDLGPRSRPHSLAFMPDGRRVVATMEQADRIALVDIENLTILETRPTGGREGHMVRLSPDGRLAYVASRGGEGTLSIVSLVEDVPPVVIPTGAGAEGLAVTPDGTEVWVANRDAASLSVVDPIAAAVVATVETHPGPSRVDISAAGRVLVPSGGTPESSAKYVTVYDAFARRAVVEREARGRRDAPASYRALIVGEQAFVVDRATRTITLVDLATLDTVATISSGELDADGLAYSPLRVGVLEDDD